jgi:DNA primase
VVIEETEASPEQRAFALASDSLFAINHFARDFFQRQLDDHAEGIDIALPYLEGRGFQPEIIRKFQIGFNPDQRDLFAQSATSGQYSRDWLLKSGLVVQRDGQLVDNYRGRIIFPIHNQSGKVLGFGARVIRSNDKSPKYINTPENELYVKSRILYGSYLGRQAIDKQDECLLVEGYTDVMALHQAGVENVMASGGTALTPDQLRLIKKYSNNLTILYDGDAAGIKAAMRGLDLALEEGLRVQLVLLPDNEDPDSYVHHVGTEAFRQYIQQNKKDIILFQLEVMLKDAGNDSSKKAAAVNTIAESISKIYKAEDFTRQQDYIRRSAELLKINEAGLHNLVNKLIRERIIKEEKSTSGTETTVPNQTAVDGESVNLFNKDEQHERAIVRCLLDFGHLQWTEEETVAHFIFNELKELEIDFQKELNDIIILYYKWLNEGMEPGIKNFIYHEDTMISTTAVGLQDFKHQISLRWKEEPHELNIPTREELYREELESVIIYLKLRKVKWLIENNQRDIEKPNTPEDLKIYLETHQELKQIEMELSRALGTVIIK